jgi:hypothetical protein
MIHLLRLAVGIEDVDHLKERQLSRPRPEVPKKLGAVVWSWTKRKPTRAEELCAGGSLYWVIKGRISVRQEVVHIDEVVDADGETHARLILRKKWILTDPVPKRAFQGWRYLASEDAPADLDARAGKSEELPPHLQAELRALGLL